MAGAFAGSALGTVLEIHDHSPVATDLIDAHLSNLVMPLTCR
jgi:hypothetical protein